MDTSSSGSARSIPLSQVDGSIEIAPNYRVEVEAGEFLTLTIPCLYGTPAARVESPGIVARVDQLLEFKHYLPNGGKRWTAKAGTVLYVVLPKSAIELVLECGYSYVPVVINGVKTCLNVTGMGAGGWVDLVRGTVEISCGHTAAQVRAIASMGVPPDQFGARGISFQPPQVEESAALTEVRAAKDEPSLLNPGAMVALRDGYNFQGQSGPFPFVQMRRGGRVELRSASGSFLAHRRQIDWTATALLRTQFQAAA